MKSFDYHHPATLAEALAAWIPGSAWLAGGTNLVDLMKTGAATPVRLVDLGGIPELVGISAQADGGLRIGAMTRNADMVRHPDLAARYPMLAEAILSGASGQIRNVATLAGNLLQETRCAYFADPESPCNRRLPGAGCSALGSEARNAAILGWSGQCIATHPSDMAVPLLALEARVDIAGPEGTRQLPLAGLWTLPWAEAPGGTVLQPGEIITALVLPAEAAGFAGHSRYLKLRERTSFAFALASAAACLQIEGGRITAARLTLGAVAAMPWRVSAAEASLIGRAPDAEAFSRAAELALAGARPSGANAGKIVLARRVAARALAMAAAGTPDRMPALPASPFAETIGELSHA